MTVSSSLVALLLFLVIVAGLWAVISGPAWLLRIRVDRRRIDLEADVLRAYEQGQINLIEARGLVQILDRCRPRGLPLSTALVGLTLRLDRRSDDSSRGRKPETLVAKALLAEVGELESRRIMSASGPAFFVMGLLLRRDRRLSQTKLASPQPLTTSIVNEEFQVRHVYDKRARVVA